MLKARILTTVFIAAVCSAQTTLIARVVHPLNPSELKRHYPLIEELERKSYPLIKPLEESELRIYYPLVEELEGEKRQKHYPWIQPLPQ